MDIDALFKDKTIKPKQKTETLCNALLNGSVKASDLIAFAGKAKDSPKATCIEALEFASRQNPGVLDKKILTFVTNALTEKAPRVKWESAKVIGNIAPLYPNDLKDAAIHLLNNATHAGTVVRWSAAFALAEILNLKTPLSRSLLPAIESLCQKEEKNSIRKIYLGALKKYKSTSTTNK